MQKVSGSNTEQNTDVMLLDKEAEVLSKTHS